jgi:hypothetical protein
MIDVVAQHPLEVPSSDDEEPVQALAPQGAEPTFHHGVGAGRSHRRADNLHALGAEDLIGGGGELGVPIVDQEPELRRALAECTDEVPCLLGHPLPGRVDGDPGQMHDPASDLDDR